VREEPTAGETAAVQVMSRANRTVLAKRVERFAAAGLYNCLFDVCHAPAGDLDAPETGKVQVWARGRLSECALRADLFDWIMAKTE